MFTSTASRAWLAGAAFLGIVAPLFACGPFPPEQILLSHRVVLRTPVGDYAQEVLALTAEDSAPTLPPGMTRVPAAPSEKRDALVSA